MRKFKDMKFIDQLQAILLTKIQENLSKAALLSNNRKLTRIIDKMFDIATKAHFKLFTGMELNDTVKKLPFLERKTQENIVNKILLPFCRRNAAISLRQISLHSGVKYNRSAIRGAGVVVLVKVLLNKTDSEAMETLDRLLEEKNGHGKTSRPAV